MSYYQNGPVNTDQRPMPWGFVQRFDGQYQRWYYVNTQTNPPTPSWIHPADEHGGQWQQGPPGGGYAQPGYGGQPQQYYAQEGHKKSGMSTGAAVALGAGAGLVGGLVVADAIQDAQEDAYAEGFEDGQDES